MVSVVFLMDARLVRERVNIRNETAAKVAPEPWRLALVNPESIDEIQTVYIAADDFGFRAAEMVSARANRLAQDDRT
jgi:hypothetical protein